MDKVKRSVIFQPLSHGGRNFPDFRTQVKSLCLSWLGRLLHSSNEIETWQAIPNEYFNQQGGLAFLLKCNYDTKKLNKRIPLFYCQMLNYFMELRCNYQDLYKSKFIIWNNKEITIIENKSIYWKHLFEKEICFVHDLLDENGKFLSLEDFQFK